MLVQTGAAPANGQNNRIPQIIQARKDEIKYRINQRVGDARAATAANKFTEARAALEDAKVARDSDVTVSISRGQKLVPDVVGKTQDEAEQLIHAAGFVPKPSPDSNSTEPAGTVTGQTPPADTPLPQGANVFFTVSSGPSSPPTSPPTSEPTSPPTSLPTSPASPS